MGLSLDLVGRDLGLIFGETFRIYGRTRKCEGSYDPYLLGDGHFVNYKLCLSAVRAENTDLSVGDVLEYDRKQWQIVHIELLRALCKIFLQEGCYAEA
ncbi:hypothetical protein [Helicobacter felis]|uniref:hypothetical protein n=1 Tax=Helicobacter felis TaxID=214 RepID=UPI000CF16BEE|nr:hypothetical protein [Helicobacter felis]